jgi:hypothetical protein
MAVPVKATVNGYVPDVGAAVPVTDREGWLTVIEGLLH